VIRQLFLLFMHCTSAALETRATDEIYQANAAADPVFDAGYG
jgi:hypothetical protein